MLCGEYLCVHPAASAAVVWVRSQTFSADLLLAMAAQPLHA